MWPHVYAEAVRCRSVSRHIPGTYLTRSDVHTAQNTVMRGSSQTRVLWIWVESLLCMISRLVLTRVGYVSGVLMYELCEISLRIVEPNNLEISLSQALSCLIHFMPKKCPYRIHLIDKARFLIIHLKLCWFICLLLLLIVAFQVFCRGGQVYNISCYCLRNIFHE